MVRVSINVPEGSEPAHEGSRGSKAPTGRLPALPWGLDPLSAGVTVLGIVAGAMLVATLFLTITSVDVASNSCEVIYDSNPRLGDRCTLSGFERHGPAFALLGALALVMAVGAGLGGSRPAALALMAIGLVAVVVTLVTDLESSGQTGAIGRLYGDAKAVRGPGLYVELLGGGLAAAAGLVRLLNRRD